MLGNDIAVHLAGSACYVLIALAFVFATLKEHEKHKAPLSRSQYFGLALSIFWPVTLVLVIGWVTIDRLLVRSYRNQQGRARLVKET